MKSKNLVKYIKHIILIGLISCGSIFCVCVLSIKADFGSSNYEENILKTYTKNSLNYKKTALEAQKYILVEDEYQQKLKSYEEQIANANINSETMNNLRIAYEDSLLQTNIYSFYVESGEKWIAEKGRKNRYKFLLEYLKIPMLKAKRDYAKLIIKELNETLNNVKAQYKLGYATKLDIDTVETNIIIEKANLNTTEGELAVLELKMCDELGVSSIGAFSLQKAQGVKNQKKYEKKYSDNNTTLRYLKVQEEAYKIYKKNMDKQGNGFEDYAKKADIELKLLDLDEKQYKNSITIKIIELLTSYQSETIQLEAKEKELGNLKMKVKNNEILYDKGKIQKIELTKLETEKSKLYYEKVCILYNQNIAYYALSNYIDE